MNKVDFVFTFEHKARELDNLSLIALEMENRGYTTAIINLKDVVEAKKKLYQARVGIIPAAYDNKSLFYSFADSISVDKVVNMQWEQVFSVHQEEDLQSRRNIKDIAKDVVHLSWGSRNRDRLVNVCGIDQDKVKITGHIAMDFLRPEFRDFYKNREDLLSEYQIPLDSQVCLFISSFTSTGALKHEVDKAAKTLGKKIYDRRLISIETQKMVLDWLERYLQNNQNTVFVYRPHPAERDNPDLMRMEEELSNFRVIRDYSVKQWIIAVDALYTWCSTSIVEAYFAEKNCHVLRPIPLPRELDMMIYQGGRFIETYEQFADSLLNPETDFPLNEALIHQYYVARAEQPIYRTIADILEEVYHDDKYNLTTQQKNTIPFGLAEDGETVTIRRMKNRIKRTFLADIYYHIMHSEKWAKIMPTKLRKKQEYYRILQDDNRRKNATTEEKIQVKNKLKSLYLK